ncbi:MAG TPA: helix-turn-helix domain-containing protein [Mucilaginibacter sp.]
MYTSLGIVDFIILFLALHGLVLSIVLAYHSRKIRSNYWIAALIFVIAEITLVNEAQQSGYLEAHTRIIPFIPVLRLAVGPMLYFYIRSLVYNKVRLDKKDYWHFLPLVLDMQFLIIAILYISGILAIPSVQQFYFTPAVQRLLFRRSIFLDNLPVLLSLSAYSIACLRMIRSQLAVDSQSAYKLADLKRARNIVYMIIAQTIGLLITVILYTYTYVWSYYIIFIPATIFIYWTGMAIYQRQSHMTAEDVLEYVKPIPKVYFTDEEANTYKSKLIYLMETDKVYLDPSLKMDMLADKLLLTERSVSNLLNHHIGKNFNDFINEYRVEESKRKLVDPACRQFTIAAIGLDCGFNSLATFQRCFKQITGVTPGQYQKLASDPNTTQIMI